MSEFRVVVYHAMLGDILCVKCGRVDAEKRVSAIYQKMKLEESKICQVGKKQGKCVEFHSEDLGNGAYRHCTEHIVTVQRSMRGQ
jgi:hypothetical protein